MSGYHPPEEFGARPAARPNRARRREIDAVLAHRSRIVAALVTFAKQRGRIDQHALVTVRDRYRVESVHHVLEIVERHPVLRELRARHTRIAAAA